MVSLRHGDMQNEWFVLVMFSGEFVYSCLLISSFNSGSVWYGFW